MALGLRTPLTPQRRTEAPPHRARTVERGHASNDLPGPFELALRHFLFEQHRGLDGFAAHAAAVDDAIESLRTRWRARRPLSSATFDALMADVLEEFGAAPRGAKGERRG